MTGKSAESGTEPGDMPLRPRRGWLPAVLRRVLAHPLWRHSYRVVMIVVLSLLLDQLNIAGTQKGFNNLAQDMVMQLGGVVPAKVGGWPVHDPLRGTEATQGTVAKAMRADTGLGVTLVLWTDPAMQYVVAQGDADDVWPINYRAHTETLLAATTLGAKAVFLDFVFPTERSDESLAELENFLLLDLPQSETRLFIACDPVEYGPPAFDRLVAAVKAANEKAGALGKSEPVVSFVPATLPTEAVSRTYDLTVPVFNPQPVPEACGGHGGFPGADGEVTRSASAAPALIAAADALPGLTLTADTPPMTIFWDRRTHVVTETLFTDAKTAPQHWCVWLLEVIQGFFLDLDLLRRDLSGPPVVPADQLYAASIDVVKEDPRTITITDLIEDRIVIIGSAQPSAADIRHTPNAPDRPGALIHALAVDNLLQFGVDYVKERPVGAVIPAAAGVPWLGTADMSFVILLTVLVLSAMLFTWWVEQNPMAYDTAEFREVGNEPVAHRMRYSIAIGIGAVVLTGGLLLILRLPPANWFSTLLSFALITAPLALAWISRGLVLIMFTRDPCRAVPAGPGGQSACDGEATEPQDSTKTSGDGAS
jgi:hypothetical protein